MIIFPGKFSREHLSGRKPWIIILVAAYYHNNYFHFGSKTDHSQNIHNI